MCKSCKPFRSKLVALLSTAAIVDSVSSTPVDATQGNSCLPAEIIADKGGTRSVQGEWTCISAIVAEHYVEPLSGLIIEWACPLFARRCFRRAERCGILRST